MSSTKKISVSHGFNRISNSWCNPRWQSLLVTRWASSSASTCKMYLILLTEKIKDFPLKEKIFSKPQKEGSINPLPPLYHVRGMNLRVRPRVKLLCVHEKFQVFWENPLLSTTQPNLAIKRLNRVKNSAKYDSGAPNENIVQNHLNIALLNVFSWFRR